MKRKFLIVLLSIVCALCLALGISACSAGGTNSTLVMEEGIVYFTDFSIKYTSAADSPNGDINENSLTDEISGSVQSYYLVMDFNMQLASNTDGLEYITVKFVVLEADVVETIINYADTSNVSAITSNGQTTITATYSLPDKAKSVKNVNLVLELKPKTTGGTDIYYYFSSGTKQIGIYTDEEITYNYSSSNISISKTSLEYTLNDDGQSYSVTGIGTKSGDVKFKETYNGLPVTAIGNYAFEDCTSLTGITIPDSVTSIGNGAFQDCTALENVTISNSATSIGTYTFQSCKKLTSITIPDSVTSIDRSAFEFCTALESITIPNNVTSIGDWAFGSCTSLTSVTIGNSVASIGSYAFEYCTALESVTIPDSVTSIGYYAFSNCTSLTNISISDNVPYICNYAFYECTSLTYYEYENGYYLGNENNNFVVLIAVIDSTMNSFTIHSKAIAIYQYAFQSCKNLTSITIPNSVTSIGMYAFSECTALTSVTIPDSVTLIDFYAFQNCTSLTSVTIPNSVTSINGNTFQNCTSLTSITIPDSVTSIGSQAFQNCTSLTSITIPNSVTSIGWSAFELCTALENITISDSITSIGWSVFRYCTKLTSVTIPNSVASIGAYAFDGCSMLTNVTFENTSGWYVTTTEGTTSGTDISSSKLSDTSTAATNLKNTYYDYYWYRSEN